MKQKVHLTLYYDTLQDACEAGFPDAIFDDDEGQYMAIASFDCSRHELNMEIEV
jgi:hypothetical protein